MIARTLVLAASAALLLPPAALAKGPIAANVSGPGDGGGGISIGGNGEGGNNTPLGRLVESAGFFPAAFGQVPDPTLRERPKGRLGPRYTISYRVPGPNNEDDTIVQDVYPYATPAALTYMRPGQPFFGTERTHGGWFVGGAALTDVLVDAGLPPTGTSTPNPAPAPPAPSSDGAALSRIAPPLVALAILLGLVWYAVSRREPTPGTR